MLIKVDEEKKDGSPAQLLRGRVTFPFIPCGLLASDLQDP